MSVHCSTFHTSCFIFSPKQRCPYLLRTRTVPIYYNAAAPWSLRWAGTTSEFQLFSCLPSWHLLKFKDSPLCMRKDKNAILWMTKQCLFHNRTLFHRNTTGRRWKQGDQNLLSWTEISSSCILTCSLLLMLHLHALPRWFTFCIWPTEIIGIPCKHFEWKSDIRRSNRRLAEEPMSVYSIVVPTFIALSQSLREK